MSLIFTEATSEVDKSAPASFGVKVLSLATKTAGANLTAEMGAMGKYLS